jgi:hypothetical protein
MSPKIDSVFAEFVTVRQYADAHGKTVQWVYGLIDQGLPVLKTCPQRQQVAAVSAEEPAQARATHLREAGRAAALDASGGGGGMRKDPNGIFEKMTTFEVSPKA